MASPKIYPSGLQLAGTVFENGPASLQGAGGTYFSGGIQWLDTINGSDANAGTLPELPVKTLAQAVTNSTDEGLIIIGEGSAETLTVSQGLSNGNVSIFGCGAGSSRPRYTCAGTIDMFAVTGPTWIENIYFPASTAVATDRIGLAVANCVVKDCYFECGANDTNRALRIHTSANSARIDGCSFVTVASRPAIGLEISAVVTYTTILNCTFDGGSYGWSDYALKVSAAATQIKSVGLTFTNRADWGTTVTGTTYRLTGINLSGTSNVLLTA